MQRLINYGGEGEIIQIAHANAYVPECYNQLANHLTDRYKVIGQRSRALWPNEPPEVMKGWKLLADDMIETMSANHLKDVIAIGHSSGAIASWLVARRRPDLIKKLILIDPVILPRPIATVFSMLPFAVLKRIFPMINIALRRTDSWDSLQDISAYLKSKSVFSAFHPDVFDDFLQYGFKKSESGKYRLAYPKEWEARIYGNVPNVWPIIATMPCPSLVIKAAQSNVITSQTWNKIKAKMKNAEFHEEEDSGHLLPFEKPKITAALIQNFLSTP